MYKVILVDDEILTRETISESTNWEKAGFFLAGTAENGKAAISVIESVRPKLVITDITMPVMDGLELSKYIRENYPEIAVIIISGYNEFEYAKKALSYGVMEYLLKPFTPDELFQVLLKANEELSKRIESEEEMETLKAEKEINRQKLQKVFVKELLEGKATSRNLLSQMENFGMSAVYDYQAVVFVAINNAGDFYENNEQNVNDSDELLNFAIANIIGELIDKKDGILQFIETDQKGIYVFSADTKEQLDEKIKQMGKRFIENVKKYLGVDISIIVGDTVESVADWPISLNSVKSAEKNAFSGSKDSFIYNNAPNKAKESEGEVQLTEYTDKIIELLKQGNEEKMLKTCGSLFDDLKSRHLEKNDILFRIQNIAFAILMQLKTILNPAQQLLVQNHDFFQDMQHCRHISELQQQFIVFLNFIYEQVSAGFMTSNQKLAFQAREYIERNFSREDLTLNDVCTFLGMSPSYFSVVYKNETGETFIETMTRVRMERAKVLLLDATRKNYEIAEQVGFSDSHYFGNVFKKYTGMTPSEYGKKVRGER